MSMILFVEPKTNKLQFDRGVSLTTEHTLEEFNFYIPQQCVPVRTSVFLIMKQDSGVRDVVELTRIGSRKSSYNYEIYAVAATQTVRIHSGATNISIMFLDENDIVRSTEALRVKMDISSYQFTHQIALLRNVNIAITEHYEKIVQLLMKLIEKGETNYDSKDDSGTSGAIS